jgi:hypothetical protein
LATVPDVVKRDPWHGHSNWLAVNPLTVHRSCVHAAVSALNDSCAMRATRKLPSDVCTKAAEPTLDNAGAESTFTVIVRPLTEPDTLASCGAEDEGLVGLPLHAARLPPASTDAVLQA